MEGKVSTILPIERTNMKIETSTVTKLLISDIPHLDAISLFLEDFGPGRGKVTINVYSDSWSAGWGAMGEGLDIRQFLIKCDNDYLIRKLSVGIERTIDSYDGLVEDAKKSVIERRKDDWISKEQARILYNDADVLGGCDCRERMGEFENELQQYFGDEWYDCLPQKPNPKYEYLKKIVLTIQEALKLQ